MKKRTSAATLVSSFSFSLISTLALAFSVTIATLVASPAGEVLVSNRNDSGPGSFRDAIDQANLDPAIGRILFDARGLNVTLQHPVEFTGAQALAIEGNGAKLSGTNLAPGEPALRFTGGANLTLSNLAVRNAPAEGIVVDVPRDATGTIVLSLSNVQIIGNLGHGVLVNDQDDPSTEDGVPPNPAGSAASVVVSVVNSRFIGNGYSVSDRDGLRVNEGGDGDLLITLIGSTAQDNAADGIEVDERGAGDVQVGMLESKVIGNGVFDPEDLDDGFDIDESGDGSIVGIILASAANDNYEEGFDFNENDGGDLRVDMLRVEANGNREEGIDYEEDDDFAGGGDLVATMTQVTANGNGVDGGDAGLKIREKGVGDLNVIVSRVQTSENLIGGISIREDGVGGLVASVSAATSLGNTGRGIDFDENGDGNLTATLTRSQSLTNIGLDLRADQQAPGAGSFVLYQVAFGATGGSVVPNIVP